MMETVTNLLIELKNGSQDDPRELISKYDMIFFGENFSNINSLELAHYLKNNFDEAFNHDYLFENLPLIASQLGMELQPMVALEDDGKSNKTLNYQIKLF